MDASTLFPILAACFLFGSVFLFRSIIWSSDSGDEAMGEALDQIATKLGFSKNSIELPEEILQEAVPGSAFAIHKKYGEGDLYGFFASAFKTSIQDELTIVLLSKHHALHSFYFWPEVRPLVEQKTEQTQRVDFAATNGNMWLGHEYICNSSFPSDRTREFFKIAAEFVSFINQTHHTSLALEIFDNKIWLRAPLDLRVSHAVAFTEDALAFLDQLATRLTLATETETAPRELTAQLLRA